jgi:hypothetical protein
MVKRRCSKARGGRGSRRSSASRELYSTLNLHSGSSKSQQTARTLTSSARKLFKSGLSKFWHVRLHCRTPSRTLPPKPLPISLLSSYTRGQLRCCLICLQCFVDPSKSQVVTLSAMPPGRVECDTLAVVPVVLLEPEKRWYNCSDAHHSRFFGNIA